MSQQLKRFLMLALTLVWLCPMSVIGQDNATYLDQPIEKRSFDREEWAKKKKSLKYDKIKPEKKKDTNEQPVQSQSDGSMFGDSNWVKIGFYSVFGLVLLFLVIRLMTDKQGIAAGRAKAKKKYTIENVEDNLHESDLERFLRESLQKGDYRQAIRLYYLMVIKELSEKRIIRWKKDKTNHEYLKEMRKNDGFQAFRRITRIFDKVWYGETEVKQPDYKQLSPLFQDFLKLIRK